MEQPEAPDSGTGRAIRALLTTAIATFVGAIAFVDDLVIGPIVIALAAWLPALVTFAVAAGAYSFVTLWACEWMLRRWESWIAGNGSRLERRFEKWRRGRLLKYPVRWIERGSTFWFALASVILGTVIVVAVARLSTGEPVPRRRVVVSAVVYGVWFAALYTAIGFGIGGGVRDLLG